MHINIGGDTVFAQSLTHQWADSKVRHVMVIHYIKVYPVSTCSNYSRYICT